MQKIGEVRFVDDSDFDKLKSLCEVHDGWKMVYNKNGVVVRTKANDVSDFSIFKIQGGYSDVSANTLYDVLHDPHYRKSWDPYIVEGFDICRISPNSDIGYYAKLQLKCKKNMYKQSMDPEVLVVDMQHYDVIASRDVINFKILQVKLVKPLMNRDFVTQRSWLDLGAEKLIMNHSVNHASVPPKKNFVRGISYITGYHMVATNERGNPDQPGCFMTYVTQSDPKGHLPVWVVNLASSLAAPKVMSRLLKACRGYETWKSQHRPEHRPWLYPEQNSLPQFDPADIRPMSEATDAVVVDESCVREEETEASGDELAPV